MPDNIRKFELALKPLLRIFTFIFLLAMASTLLQSSGLIEEEIAHGKTELSKKDNTKEGSGDGDEDGGDDDAADSDFISCPQAFNWSGILTATRPYAIEQSRYRQGFSTIQTPPPKI